jgi:hypothetical protein
MIRLKRLRNRIKTAERDQRIRGFISNSLLAAQRKAADYLNRKTAHWSPRRIKIALILFCLVTGNIGLYITGKAILSANGPPGKTKVHQLYAPMTPPGSKQFHSTIPVQKNN